MNANGAQRMPDKDNFGAVLMRQREGKDGGGKGPLISEEKSLTLATSNDQVLAKQMQVRRLTPVECERLQGFPDNFTRIPWTKKPAEDCPDGPRYKALGNSMAVPCMKWIGERIGRQAC
jgi:DNA (cytosine-5)-methyltransferase 1